MTFLRHLITYTAVFALAVPAAYAQSNDSRWSRFDFSYATNAQESGNAVPTQSAAGTTSLHPAAKGALIGAAVGVASWGAIGLWYCTIGPNEVGECSNARMWTQGFAVWGGVGAAVGALIGAIRH
jgi:hypothetical protein